MIQRGPAVQTGWRSTWKTMSWRREAASRSVSIETDTSTGAVRSSRPSSRTRIGTCKLCACTRHGANMSAALSVRFGRGSLAAVEVWASVLQWEAALSAITENCTGLYGEGVQAKGARGRG